MEDSRNKQSIKFLLNSPTSQSPVGPGFPASLYSAGSGNLAPIQSNYGVDQRHSKQPSLKCHLCSRTFGKAAAVRKHMRVVHEKVKDFPCEFCEYRCAEKSNLKKHVQARHQQSRSHRCNQCDKVFSFSDGLRRHINNCHLKLRPHVCHICQASFKQRTHLQKHCQSIHNFELGLIGRRGRS